MTKISAIIVGAGKSSRMNGVNKLTEIINKVNNFSVLESSVYPFTINERINNIVIVTSPETLPEATRIQQKYPNISIVLGGATRAESVQNAINSIDCDIVLIHDGARPYVSNSLINRVINCVVEHGSSVPYINESDSLFNLKRSTYVHRDDIKRIQTPQSFDFKLLKTALQNTDNSATDEGMMFNKYVKPIALVEGDKNNIKITTQVDLVKKTTVGVGFDTHVLVPNRPLVLGGITLDYPLGLLGHSDADVLTHAIMDALLGGAGLRDIGYYFPDNDNKYLNINSQILLKKVGEMLTENGYYIENIHATIMAEKPKLNPHIPAMVKTLANTLGIDAEKISLSATTTEKLGIIGEGKGIATHAVCSLVKF